MLFAYIISINGKIVNTKDEIVQHIKFLFDDAQPDIDTLKLTIAPDNRKLKDAANITYDIPQIQMDQLRNITSVVHHIDESPSFP